MSAEQNCAGFVKKRPPVHDVLRRHGVEPLFTR